MADVPAWVESAIRLTRDAAYMHGDTLMPQANEMAVASRYREAAVAGLALAIFGRRARHCMGSYWQFLFCDADLLGIHFAIAGA